MSITAKYNGKCSTCGGFIPAGLQVMYDPETRTVRHKRGECGRAAADEANRPQQQRNGDQDKVTDDTKILGKAAYRGKSGYLILWSGMTKRGTEASKLAFRDGSKIFWVDMAEVRIEKTYQDREMTFGRLNRLRNEYGRAKAEGREACGKCGGLNCGGDGGCYMCGCRRCEGAHGGLCEED